MKETTYICNMCGLKFQKLKDIIGLIVTSNGVIVETLPKDKTTHHLCFKCISSIQVLEKRCGAGFVCAGGPLCESSHK